MPRGSTGLRKTSVGDSMPRPWGGRVWNRGGYFRLLLIGYFEGLDAERGIAWRAADSLAVRGFLRLGIEESGAGPLDDLAHASADRCRHASGRLYVGPTAVGGRRIAERPHDCDRRDDAGSQCRDAEHRPPRHGRELSGVLDAARGDLGIKTPTREALARLDRNARRRRRTRTGPTRTIPTRRSPR